MTKLATTLILTLIALAAVFAPAPALAQAPQGHVLLHGYAQRTGSLTAVTPSGTAVYVFIDEVEGRLDVGFPEGTTLSLVRGDTVLFEVDPAEVMSVAEIQALYLQPQHARRRAETLTALNGARDDDTPVTSQTFAQRLHEAVSAFAGEVVPPLPPQPWSPTDLALIAQRQLRTWTTLAARFDPLIGVARYRAFIDTGAPAGPITYKLFARHAATSREAEIANVTIDTGLVHHVPEPATFVDVSQDQARCDAPDSGRAHYTVALDWRMPGANATDRLAHGINVAGWDLWRTTGPCTDADPYAAPDALRTRAEGGVVGLDGSVAIAGLVRVNTVPILLREAPASGRDDNRTGWNPPFAQWIEDRQSLAKSGLRPGDQVCYLVAARDRSGNYGRSSAVVARIPDMARPPAPWSVASLADTEVEYDISVPPPESYNSDVYPTHNFRLEWPAVDVKSWLYDHTSVGVACNLPQAYESQRLTLADDRNNCTNPTSVYLDVQEYRVYRFDDPNRATTFTDADGDGFGDDQERVSLENLGTACDPDLAGSGDNAHVLGTFETRVEPDGRQIIVWTDSSDGPATDLGGIYWYRVAAIGKNGRVSALTPPVRGLFPDVVKPNRPSRDEVEFGTCEPQLEQLEEPEYDNDFRLMWAIDKTSQGTDLRLYCIDPAAAEGGGVPSPTTMVESYVGSVPMVAVKRHDGTVAYAPDALRTLLGSLALDGCEAFVEIVDGDNHVVASGPVVPDPDSEAPEFTMVLNSNRLCEHGSTELRPGQVIDRPIKLRRPLASDDECYDVFIDIGGRRSRLDTICGDATFTWVPPDMGRLDFCLSISVLSAGSRTPSSNTELGCNTSVPPAEGATPSVPRLAGLTLPHDGTDGTLRWYGPEQTIGGLIVEYWQKDEPARTSAYFDADGRQGGAEAHDSTFPIGALQVGTEQEWCIRAQAVSASTPTTLGGKLSFWTQPVCGARRFPAPGLPEYLAFPTLPIPGKLGDLFAGYLRVDGLPFVRLGILTNAVDKLDVGTDPETCDETCGCLPPACNPQIASCVGLSEVTVALNCNLCAQVVETAGANLRFVAYRQRRVPGVPGSEGPWVQVSPLLERPFCGIYVPPDNHNQGATVVRGPGVRLADPYFAFIHYSSSSGPTFRLHFMDRTPHVAGGSYRYQLVVHDADGEPSGWLETNWVEVPSL